jgi:hypothetical protein
VKITEGPSIQTHVSVKRAAECRTHDMAGAGAIGNGFLWAARHVDIRGTLHIADDDRVSSGNLNRRI